MSEKEKDIYNFIENLFAKQRDFPQNKTLSKLLYDLKGDIKVITEVISEMKNDMSEIKTQTKLTNGRVNSLEIWKATLTGKMAGISLVISSIVVVVGLVINYYK